MKELKTILFCAGSLLCLAGCAEISSQSAAETSAPHAAVTESAAETSAEAVTETGAETTVCTTTTVTAFDPANIPPYSGEPVCEVNNNIPFFREPYPSEPYESYSPLDALGRCGVCEACISPEMLPEEKRESIGAVTPSGWQLIRYDGLVDGNYLFNRCHLIAHMLTGQNANECNLITGTRYLNKEGMLPYEIMTADYIRATGNHVLYRVTPVFTGDNLLADGVCMEALSVEDGGRGLCFNVYCYNVQPQIVIDYANGDSRLAEAAETAPAERAVILPAETEPPAGTEPSLQTETAQPAETALPAQTEMQADYILNMHTMRFHRPDCPSADDISDRNKASFSGSREELLAIGYEPCKRCQP